MTTLIKNGLVVAHDHDGHKIIRDGCVAFQGPDIVFVGESYAEKVDEVIDATGMIVIPGLVNAHLHVTDTAFTRGFLDDFASPSATANQDGLYRILPTVRGATGIEDELAGRRVRFSPNSCSPEARRSSNLGFDAEMMEGG